MGNEEFQPSIRPPRLMTKKGVEAERATSSVATPLSQPSGPKVEPSTEERCERQNTSVGGAEETSASAVKNEGAKVQDYSYSSRDGDNDIFPSLGKPKLMSGTVKPRTRPTPAFNERKRQDDEGAQHKLSIGFLPFVGWACCLIAVLWIVTVSSPFLANALVLHGWRFWASLVFALLPSLFVFGVMLYALMRFRKIPHVEQFSESSFVDKLEELQDKLIVHYLGKIADPQRYAIENGYVEEGISADDAPIVDSLKRLKGEIPSHCSGSDGWLYLFKDFQRMQDERAKEIIGKTWKLVAIKTAASPWKIVDMIAVVYNSTVMITRLAKLYNRRTSSQAAFRLVCRWIINIYIAGEMGEVAQGATEWASANDLISATYKPLAGFVGKIAEGGANAFLVYRLGSRAMVYFRPLC